MVVQNLASQIRGCWLVGDLGWIHLTLGSSQLEYSSLLTSFRLLVGRFEELLRCQVFGLSTLVMLLVPSQLGLDLKAWESGFGNYFGRQLAWGGQNLVAQRLRLAY